MRTREHIVVPGLDTQGTKKAISMTKTTKGLSSELNKTDEQNTTHKANIFEDKDIENRKDLSCNNKQSDDHMQQQIQCVDGVKQAVNWGCLQQSYMKKKMVHTFMKDSRLPTMALMHGSIAGNITGTISVPGARGKNWAWWFRHKGGTQGDRT